MSLDKAAQHLAAHGRGSDTELIHMSKREIRGLQQLAEAHGGSLTINPHTGLPEAGFLEQALPIVAAAAATYFTAGAAAPMLMEAGLGATASGLLAGAGAGAVIGGASSALQGRDVGQGALTGGIGGALAGGMGAFDAPVPGSTPTPPATPLAPAGATPPVAPTPVAPTPTVTPPGPATPGFTPSAGASQLPTPTQLADTQAFTGVDAANQPIVPPSASTPNVPTNAPAGQSWWDKLTPGGKVMVGGTGLMAATSLLGNTGNKGLPGAVPVANTIRLSPDFKGGEPRRPNPYYHANYSNYADGGAVGLAPGGGPVEQMSQENQNQFYPQGQQEHTNFATPTQMPTSAEVVDSGYDPKTDAYTGTPMAHFAIGGEAKKKKATLTTAAKLAAMDPQDAAVAGLGNAMYHAQMPAETAKGLQPTTNLGQLNLAEGGHLGSYSDGGRLLKGPGDGVSDDIPAQIGKHQPARLADGEFVIPARIVSELGNGSTDAGARRLYEMMDKVQASRKKSIGKGKFAVNSKAAKHLPK